jgi:hypothetical protein
MSANLLGEASAEHLAKPVDPEHLARCLARVIRAAGVG